VLGLIGLGVWLVLRKKPENHVQEQPVQQMYHGGGPGDGPPYHVYAPPPPNMMQTPLPAGLGLVMGGQQQMEYPPPDHRMSMAKSQYEQQMNYPPMSPNSPAPEYAAHHDQTYQTYQDYQDYQDYQAYQVYQSPVPSAVGVTDGNIPAQYQYQNSRQNLVADSNAAEYQYHSPRHNSVADPNATELPSTQSNEPPQEMA
jgi:hypothetical protein